MSVTDAVMSMMTGCGIELVVDSVISSRDMFALTEDDLKIQYRKRLGEGAFCTVYPVHIRNGESKCFDEELPPFALKQLNYDIVTHENPQVAKAAYDDLQNEANIMKELQHEHILPILGMSKQSEGVNIAKDGLFIIIEMLDSTLDSKLEKWAKVRSSFRNSKNITPNETVMIRINEIALGIGRGLQYMHSINYIFRDLKPANIGFDGSGSVKIFDFGLAISIPKASSNNTIKGMAGTMRYMAPEMRKREQYSYPVDVYSFAILLWQIVTTRVPFEKEIPASSMFAPDENFDYDNRPNLKYVESNELKELLDLSWKTSPKERISFDVILPELQRIARLMSLKKDGDRKMKKQSSMIWMKH